MRFPPCSTSMRVLFAPASSAFSSSSFTTDAGRSTTSPAAILFATDSGSMRIRLICSLQGPQIVRLGYGSGHSGNDEKAGSDYSNLPRNKNRDCEQRREQVIANCQGIVKPLRFRPIAQLCLACHIKDRAKNGAKDF